MHIKQENQLNSAPVSRNKVLVQYAEEGICPYSVEQLTRPHSRQFTKPRRAAKQAERWQRCIVNTQKCRNFHMSYQFVNMEVKVGKVCPQGGGTITPPMVEESADYGFSSVVRGIHSCRIRKNPPITDSHL